MKIHGLSLPLTKWVKKTNKKVMIEVLPVDYNEWTTLLGRCE